MKPTSMKVTLDPWSDSAPSGTDSVSAMDSTTTATKNTFWLISVLPCMYLLSSDVLSEMVCMGTVILFVLVLYKNEQTLKLERQAKEDITEISKADKKAKDDMSAICKADKEFINKLQQELNVIRKHRDAQSKILVMEVDAMHEQMEKLYAEGQLMQVSDLEVQYEEAGREFNETLDLTHNVFETNSLETLKGEIDMLAKSQKSVIKTLQSQLSASRAEISNSSAEREAFRETIWQLQRLLDEQDCEQLTAAHEEEKKLLRSKITAELEAAHQVVLKKHRTEFYTAHWNAVYRLHDEHEVAKNVAEAQAKRAISEKKHMESAATRSAKYFGDMIRDLRGKLKYVEENESREIQWYSDRLEDKERDYQILEACYVDQSMECTALRNRIEELTGAEELAGAVEWEEVGMDEELEGESEDEAGEEEGAEVVGEGEGEEIDTDWS